MLVLCLTGVAPVLGKAYFMPIEDMILSADVIAVVKIVNLEAVKKEEEALQYKDQLAKIEVKETIKGDLTGKEYIMIPSFFPCGIVDVASPGEYLVFLEMREGILTSSNWHWSVRKVSGDKVPWFSDDLRELPDMPLEQVKEQIEFILGQGSS